MTDEEQNLIVYEAKSWLGTPYHSGAKIKHVGVDCGQFLIGVYENVGLLHLGECTPGDYSPEWHLHRSEEKYLLWVQKFCERIQENKKILPGDIALFRYGRCISHGGIVLNWPIIIHSYVGHGVIVSNIQEAILCTNRGESRLKGVYRFERTVW